MLSKITAASFMKLSYESDAWTMLSVILRARSPRIVPGAASYDFVEPIMIRTALIALLPFRISAIVGPEVIKETNSLKNGLSL